MSMPPDARADARLDWVRRALDAPALELEVASADASFRSYYRTRGHPRSLIVMDAPPAHEDIRPWLDIGARLRAAGLQAPEVLAADAGRGFVLMTDLGRTHYLDALDEHSAEHLYGDAMDALVRMQAGVRGEDLPAYDEAFLVREMELMPEWFLGRHLGLQPDCGQWDELELGFRILADNALAQPRVFVHRDFHSRNLLLTAADNPGIIDFQGALYGPLAYDLASLLRDCYIAWPGERVSAWVERYRLRLQRTGVLPTDVDAARFRRWFDLAGLQRHVKVLGIFCRLHYRDGKAGYLADLPRVFGYVLDVAGTYPELRGFAERLRRAVGERDLRRAIEEAPTCVR